MNQMYLLIIVSIVVKHATDHPSLEDAYINGIEIKPIGNEKKRFLENDFSILISQQNANILIRYLLPKDQ